MKKLLFGLSAICFLFALQSFAGEPKIGVVYLRKAFDSYKKTVEYDQQLMEKRNEIEKKLRDLKTEMDKIKASLEVVGEKERAKKIQEYRQKERELRTAQLEAMQNIDRDRQKFMKDILSDVKAVINEYAKEHSFDIILNGDMLLYAGEGYDVTEDIIKILNDRYSKNKK